MKVTINGIEYNPKPLHGESITSYYHRGTMVSDVKFPKLYTHGVKIDGYMVAFINPSLMLLLVGIILIPIIIITLLVLFVGKVAKDTGIVEEMFSEETTVDTGVVVVEDENSSVSMSYNAYMTYEDGEVDVLYRNGDYEATIQIVGTSVSSGAITVEPNGQCRLMSVMLDTDDDLVNAKLLITQADSDTLEYPVTIERFHYQDYGDVTFKDEEVLHE